MLQACRHLLPVRQPARQAQTRCQHVAGQIQQLPSGEVLAKKLHADLVELMGFVKNNGVDSGQQLGHARFTHCHIGKKKMVVDHHHVSGQRLPARQIDVAGPEPGALGTQTIFP